MNIDLLSQLINNQYGKCFWGEVFASEEEYQTWLNESPHTFESQRWEEFGVTLVEVGDNDMWSCIVVLRNQ